MNNQPKSDNAATIKTLFGKLTEIILRSITTKADAMAMLTAVGQWTALVIASLIVMAEKDPRRQSQMIQIFVTGVTTETVQNIRKIKTLKETKGETDERRIITPG